MLAPLLGVLVLRAPLINALPNNDTWFYSGYGWALAHHIEIFGWFYYADRFTATLPIALSTGALGPVAGYLVLRCLLLVGTGGVLYICARRFTSRFVAATGVCLLAMNPFYMRLVLWDYTTFIALPCTIAGAAVWYLGTRRTAMLITAIVSGALLGAAIYANPLSGLVLPALFAVETVAACREGRRAVVLLLTRALAALLGALLVFVAGYLGYRAYLGSFPIANMYKATLDFLRSNNQLAAPFQHPPGVWLKTEPRIYGPVLVCVGIVVVLGRSLLQNTPRSRVALFALAYTAVFWLYRFTITSSVIETWWAYSMTAATSAFALPAILDELVGRSRSRERLVLAAALVATGGADLLVRSDHNIALSVFNYLRTHPYPLLLLLIACCSAALASALVRRAGIRITALVAFLALVAVLTLTPAGYVGTGQTGEFSPYGEAEVDGYQAAYDMTRLIASRDRPQSRVLLWDSLYGLAAISWANLPHQDGGIENVEAPIAITQLTPAEIELLLYPTTTRVLVLSQSTTELASTVPSLRRIGLRPRIEVAGAWADGALYYAVIDLGKPK